MFQKFLLGKKLPKYSDQAYLPSDTITKSKIIRKAERFDVFSFLYGKGSLTIKNLKKINEKFNEDKHPDTLIRAAIWDEILDRRSARSVEIHNKYPQLDNNIFESDQFVTLAILNCCRNYYEGNENEIFRIYQKIIKVMVENKEQRTSTSNRDSETVLCEKETKTKGKSQRKDKKLPKKSSPVSSENGTISGSDQKANKSQGEESSSTTSKSNTSKNYKSTGHDSIKSHESKNSQIQSTSHSSLSTKFSQESNLLHTSISDNSKSHGLTDNRDHFDKNLIKDDEIQPSHRLSPRDKEFLHSLIHLIIFLHHNITKKEESLIIMALYFLSRDICERIDISFSHEHQNQPSIENFISTSHQNTLKLDLSPRIIPLLDCIIFFDLTLEDYLRKLLLQTHRARKVDTPKELQELIEWLCKKSIVYDVKGLQESVDVGSQPISNPTSKDSSQHYFDFLILEQQMIEAQLHLKQTFLEEINQLKRENDELQKQNEELTKENKELKSKNERLEISGKDQKKEPYPKQNKKQK